MTELLEVAEVDHGLSAKTNAALDKLDDEEFAVRETATRNLYELGESVVPLLTDALAKAESQEVRSRLRMLLKAWQRREIEYSQDELRSLRAINVLREVGGPVSLAALEKLAAGDPISEVTVRARANLQLLRGGKSPR
ncbi:MAG: hypothetical protein QM811_20140 [Pirellulales bacterium]